ncbi:MAG: T9SS type A sorting domain-containing protein [Fluviicola sp.]|nr:T9SS type A sorting domain-containing protein [Fluviicola sp.]
MKLLRMFIVGIILMQSPVLNAATCTATATGNWFDPSKWSCGAVPGCGDLVIIPAGITIDLDQHLMIDETSMPPCSSPTYIQVFGTLQFVTGKKMELACGSAVEIMVGGSMLKGTGGGSSNWLKICGANEWKASDGDVPGYALFGSPIPLPSEFISFSIENGTANQLSFSWEIASEHNVLNYTVDYSTDLITWQTVGSVASIGNQTNGHTYQLNRVTPITNEGVVYFRLRSSDIDGTTYIHDLKSYTPAEVSVSVYPNPAKSGQLVTIVLDETSAIEQTIGIYNSLGQLVVSKLIAEDQRSVSFDASELNSGIYFVKAASGNSLNASKLIVE